MNNLVKSNLADDFLRSRTHLDRCLVLMISPFGRTTVFEGELCQPGKDDEIKTDRVEEPLSLRRPISHSIGTTSQESAYLPGNSNLKTYLHPVAIIPPIQAEGPGSKGKNNPIPSPSIPP